MFECHESTNKTCRLLFDYTLLMHDLKEEESFFKLGKTEQFIDQVKFNNPELSSEELILSV